MNTLQLPPLWPLVAYFVAVLILVTAILLISYYLGQRHTARAKGEPYESGILSTGSAWLRFDIKFYLIAVFFVIFDLEAVFLLTWAIALREAGWSGFVEVLVFVGILLAALIYLWRLGALDWGTTRRKPNSWRR